MNTEHLKSTVTLMLCYMFDYNLPCMHYLLALEQDLEIDFEKFLDITINEIIPNRISLNPYNTNNKIDLEYYQNVRANYKNQLRNWSYPLQ